MQCASIELFHLVLCSSHVLSWSDQGCRPAPTVAGVSGARSVRSRLPFRPRRNFPASPCLEARIEAQRGRRTWHPWWRHSLMGGKASEMVSGAFLQHKNFDLSHYFISYGWLVTLFVLNHALWLQFFFWFSFRVFKARRMIAQKHLHSDENTLWPIDHADYADYIEMLTWCLSAQSFCFYSSQVCSWYMYKNEVGCWFSNTVYIFG